MSSINVIFKMLKLVKPLLFQMIIAIILGVLGFICAIALPVLSVMALMQGMGMYTHIPLDKLLIILLSLAVLRGVLHYGEQAANHYIAFKILAIIRDHVFMALRRLAPAKLDGKDKGNLISLITNDIELLEVFYAHTISPVVIALLTSMILLKFFAHMHIFAMVIAFIFYFLVGIVIPFYVRYLGQDIGQQNRDEIGHMSSFLLESYRGLSTLFQYGYSKKRQADMMQQSQKIETLQYQMKTIETKQMILSQLCISLSSIIMFIVMFILYKQQEISIYSVILSTVLMLSSFGPVLALSNLANHLLTTLSSGRRVISLLEEKELIEEVNGKEDIDFQDIHVNHVDFQYDHEMILKDLNVDFKQGQITGIVGKSGSGKSTLLKLLMRFYDPTIGMICINETELSEINTTNLRSLFAYVTQDTVLFHDTIYNNLKIANLKATKQDIILACQKVSIHDFIMSLPNGYETIISELGSSLSAGERQRLGLARAFLSDAPCILLDEPTSQLDVLNEAVILKSLQKQTDKTIVLVSHRESTMKIAHHVVTMNMGRMS